MIWHCSEGHPCFTLFNLSHKEGIGGKDRSRVKAWKEHHGKELPAMQETQETWVGSLGQEDHLEGDMVTHSSMLAWEIPWTEESMGSQQQQNKGAVRDAGV